MYGSPEADRDLVSVGHGDTVDERPATRFSWLCQSSRTTTLESTHHMCPDENQWKASEFPALSPRLWERECNRNSPRRPEENFTPGVSPSSG